MTHDVHSPTELTLAFGPFRFIPVRRALLRADKPLQLGRCAQEILLALVERTGTIVRKQELLARVWPHSIIEEGTLRVYIAALRKTLGDGKAGARYVETVPGLGYRFVAPVTRIGASSLTSRAQPRAEADDLPAPLARLIGRTQVLSALASQLPLRRFITIAGPGGIGKTTVAVGAGHCLRASYEHGVRYVDFGTISDPALICSTLACRLGLAIVSENPMPSVVAYLRDRRLLIILDSCERFVGAAAHLAEKLLSAAPNVHVLVASREPLRAKGEWVRRLAPLEFPQPSEPLTAAAARGFSALELFVERGRANLPPVEFNDADALIIAQICHRLDGVPLAIELAAGHVNRFGLRGLAEHLDKDPSFLTQDRVAGLPRHRTLSATHDWSYRLLPETERAVLRSLSVFVGTFSLEAARSVSAGASTSIGGAQAFLEAVVNLVAKSLVAAVVAGPEIRFRLLDTTRAYALRKLIESGETRAVARRHALHYRSVLKRAELAGLDLSNAEKAAERTDEAAGSIRIVAHVYSGQQ